ncbi:hypothetical protein ACLE20_00630 [Rhizobium sp. YIM 134829]|uniref:hypothetical protein n=1 Tax=Rhizobium sp. YIM 134829 TaxID=3390453 RepID=UPI00397AF88C
MPEEIAMTPAEKLFRSDTPRRTAGSKSIQTDSEARAIIETEERQRRKKTERLREARIAQLALTAETAPPVKAKPKRKAAAKG